MTRKHAIRFLRQHERDMAKHQLGIKQLSPSLLKAWKDATQAAFKTEA